MTLGPLLGTVGLDQLSGSTRFTFDQPWLLGGLDLIVILVGLYALPPVLQLAEAANLKELPARTLRLARVQLGRAEMLALVPTWTGSARR